MKLEDQVCSLDLAKRLKELGVKQGSHFWWRYTSDMSDTMLLDRKWESSHFEFVSAFTVAELGTMLKWRSLTYKAQPQWYEILKDETLTEADARAEMLIYLLENKLITV